MNTKYVAGIAVSLIMTGYASAATVTVGAFDFDDSTAGGIDNGDGTTPSTFVATSSTSGTLQGVFGSENYVDAAMTIADGETFEFDFAYTLAGFGGDSYGGWGYLQLLDGSGGTLIELGTNQSKDISVDGSWGGNLDSDDGTFHVTYTFSGGDLAWTVDGADGTSTTSWSGTKVGVDPTAVATLRMGINDSRRTIVFTAVPEPSTALLGGLGALALLRRRRA